MADDSYLSISTIANDEHMTERMRACATQQVALGNAPDIANDPINRPDTWAAISWVQTNRYLWASSPGWGAAWDSALASHPDDATYEPGKDPAVITDAQILSTVQTLTAESAAVAA
jgi:hypothetical protein